MNDRVLDENYKVDPKYSNNNTTKIKVGWRLKIGATTIGGAEWGSDLDIKNVPLDGDSKKAREYIREALQGAFKLMEQEAILVLQEKLTGKTEVDDLIKDSKEEYENIKNGIDITYSKDK